MNRHLLSHIAVLAFASLGLIACGPTAEMEMESHVKWGVHQSAQWANILNLKPNESIEVCAPTEEHVRHSHDAIQQWSQAIGRWGHFKINPCNSGSNLKINMEGFGSTGLNYFTSNPGRIYVKNGATGNFLQAVILHEFGHSFGLCDQYKEAGSANCSNHRSTRQENSEVMGATNSSKLRLTPGDIEGVKAAANLPSVPSTSVWQNFLGSNPSPQVSNPNSNNSSVGADQLIGSNNTTTTLSSNAKVYVKVVAGVDDRQPYLLVSVPRGANVAICTAGFFSAGDCTQNSSGYIGVQKDDTIGDRDIYRTATLRSLSTSTNGNTFNATLSGSGTQTVNRSFRVTHKAGRL